MSRSFLAVAAWGLLILASFIGWGGEIARRLFVARKVDLGLRATWGLSFVLLACAVASLASLSSRAVILFIVAAGAALGVAAWSWTRGRAEPETLTVQSMNGHGPIDPELDRRVD